MPKAQAKPEDTPQITIEDAPILTDAPKSLTAPNLASEPKTVTELPNGITIEDY